MYAPVTPGNVATNVPLPAATDCCVVTTGFTKSMSRTTGAGSVRLCWYTTGRAVTVIAPARHSTPWGPVACPFAGAPLATCAALGVFVTDSW